MRNHRIWKQHQERVEKKERMIRDPEIRGRSTETRVKWVLRRLQATGVIINFVHSEKGDRLDTTGIDFLVIFPDITMPLQIKSSNATVNRHYRKYPAVPCLVAWARLTDEQIIERILRCKDRYITYLKDRKQLVRSLKEEMAGNAPGQTDPLL